MNHILYSLPLYVIPLGYLFIPSGHYPLWMLTCIPLLFKPFLSLHYRYITLYLLAIPIYSLFLSLFVYNNYIPLGHLIAIFVPFYLFTVYNYLIDKLSVQSVVNILSNCFIVSLLILFLDIVLPSGMLSESIIVGFSGFGSDQFPDRFAGSFTEPGHFGILLNFLEPFYLYKNLDKPSFFLSIFFLPLVFLFFIGSAPTFLSSLVCSLFFLFRIKFIRILAFLPTLLNRILSLKVNTVFFLPILLFPFIFVILRSSSKFIGFFSALLTGTSTGDLLSAGNRAARMRYVLGQVLERPFGSGLAPNFLANQSVGDVSINTISGQVAAFGVDSSISIPIDLAWFVGIPLLLISFYFFLKTIYIALLHSSYLYRSQHFTLFLTCTLAFFTMIFRFTFVNNYYFPFLPLSLSLLVCSRHLLLKSYA